jgi:uncharacterized protein (TIGR02284 family)
MLTVAALDEPAVSAITDLARINTESARGFRTAAGEIQNQRIATFLRRNATERERFAVELQTLLRLSDDELEDVGSVRGSVNRWWMGLRGLMAGGNEQVILAEAAEGEEALKARYERALEKAGDNPIFETLVAHLTSIEQTRQRARELRARLG